MGRAKEQSAGSRGGPGPVSFVEFMLEWILSTEVCIWREGCLGGQWRKVSDLRVPRVRRGKGGGSLERAGSVSLPGIPGG